MSKWFTYLGPLALAAMVSEMGCLSYGDDEAEDGDTGVAQIAINQVPTDGSVGCIQVTAAGAHTVTQSVDVMPGQSTVLDMRGLSIGTVSFTGYAYQGVCAAVTSATPPTWLSDPVIASVNSMQPVMVHLVMHRSGEVIVDVGFEDDPSSCSPQGAPCFSGAACCSQMCMGGICQPGPPICGPGLIFCSNSNTCTDPMNDPLNCGGCNIHCPPGSMCQNGACMVPSCGDGIKNGNETGVDCGGSCVPCSSGQQCSANVDCMSGFCLNGVCMQCSTASNCPGMDTECQARTCVGGSCGIITAPAGAPCTQNGGMVCNGNGSCI